MKYLRPKWAGRFACAASACPDSCCRAGWEIIPDEETLKLYGKLPGPVGERIRAGIAFPLRGRWHRASPASPMTDEVAPEQEEGSEEPLLRQDGNRVCVLLDPDGLCCVQRSFGHGALCRVCREYPRFHREFGALTELGVSLSCPTAYALAVGEAPAWEEWEDDAPPVPNELDPEAYLRLRRGRDLALELLAREELPLARRMDLVRRLAAALEHRPRRIRRDYGLRLRRWSSVPEKEKYRSLADRDLPDTRNCQWSRLARRFLRLEILSDAWREDLEALAALAAAGELPEGLLRPENPEAYGRWLWCSLYKYWLDALEDGRLAARVDRSLDMVLLGLALDACFPARGPFLRRMSREIEHCEENLAALLEA